MFKIRDYILKMLDESIGKEPDYKVRENALKYHEKGVLVQADLEAIDNLIEERHKPIEEQIGEEIQQEFPIDIEIPEENLENSDEVENTNESMTEDEEQNGR